MKERDRVLCRMVDANYNRAKEALRVAEDVLRFSNQRGNPAKAWKDARHQLTRILLMFPRTYREIVACRSIQDDPGKKLDFRDQKKKLQLKDVFRANVQRSQEAVRVLEECSKLMHPASAQRFAALRFRLYDLEKRAALEI